MKNSNQLPARQKQPGILQIPGIIIRKQQPGVLNIENTRGFRKQSSDFKAGTSELVPIRIHQKPTSEFRRPPSPTHQRGDFGFRYETCHDIRRPLGRRRPQQYNYHSGPSNHHHKHYANVAVASGTEQHRQHVVLSTRGSTPLRKKDLREMLRDQLDIGNRMVCSDLLIDENMQWVEKDGGFADQLTDQKLRAVVGVVGKVRTGKSRVLCCLNCDQCMWENRRNLDVFKTAKLEDAQRDYDSSKEPEIIGRTTKGVHAFISVERAIYLDSEAVLSLLLEDRKLCGLSLDDIGLNSRILTAFMLSVCTTLLVFDDCYPDIELQALFRFAHRLKRNVLVTAGIRCVDPRIVFVLNKVPQNCSLSFWARDDAELATISHGRPDSREVEYDNDRKAPAQLVAVPDFRDTNMMDPSEADRGSGRHGKGMTSGEEAKKHEVQNLRNVVAKCSVHAVLACPMRLSEKEWLEMTCKIWRSLMDYKKSHLRARRNINGGTG